jgi:hypothetical protein
MPNSTNSLRLNASSAGGAGSDAIQRKINQTAAPQQPDQHRHPRFPSQPGAEPIIVPVRRTTNQFPDQA